MPTINNKCSERKYGVSAAFKMQELLGDVTRQLDTIYSEAEIERRNFNRLVSGVVNLAQEARTAKNYGLSDTLRKLLRDANIEVLQGSIKDVEENGRPRHDTWYEIKA